MLRTYVLLSGLILSSICIQCQSLWLEDELTSSTYLPFDTYAADLDQDGDLDVLSASKGDNKIAWYEKTAVISDLPEWRDLQSIFYPNPLTVAATLDLGGLNPPPDS